MRAKSVPQTPEQRNQAKLCEALKAGAYVIKVLDKGALVRSKSDPHTAYIATRHRNGAGATVEQCNCLAMRGPGENGYIKAVVRWVAPDGSRRNNGIVPCSHILIARFDRQWLAADLDTRAVILASVPGLEAAITANGYYRLEA